jgi:CheY-like chemotaxis protein
MIQEWIIGLLFCPWGMTWNERAHRAFRRPENGMSEPALSSLWRASDTVLVVEDEVFLRCAVGEYLRSCGLHVIETANALEAMRVLRCGTEIDIVFSDIQLPGSVDGITLAEWISREHPQTKVILTSGLAEETWSAAAGRYQILSKPYDHCDLESRIRVLLSSGADPRSSAFS